MIDGVINVYKEKGYTSHDVVARLRGILHQKKIGIRVHWIRMQRVFLPVCLGSGTKLCDMLTDKDKVYRAVMLLGQETDTQDTSGRVIKSSPVHVDEDQIRQAVMRFVGSYEQIPPMYSALKVNGRKLYELAREGREVERKARTVAIYDIQIHSIEIPYVTMSISCSKGTYIRTLCDDIGRTLGCGGCMAQLTRVQVGMFELSSALKLSQIEARVLDGSFGECVIAVDQMFREYPGVEMKTVSDKLLHNGNPFDTGDLVFCPEIRDGQWVRVYDSTKVFGGIYQYDENHRKFKVVKMFRSV